MKKYFILSLIFLTIMSIAGFGAYNFGIEIEHASSLVPILQVMHAVFFFLFMISCGIGFIGSLYSINEFYKKLFPLSKRSNTKNFS